jgi:hypothetical protein
MGARTSGRYPNTTKLDGHLSSYFRSSFSIGGGGSTWTGGPEYTAALLATRSTSGIYGGSISQKRDGSRIYMSQPDNSIVYSDNNGSSWSGVSGFSNGIYGTLIYSFGNSSIMVASTNGSNYGKIYYSTNSGSSWVEKVNPQDSIPPGFHNPDTGLIMLGDRGAGGSSSSDLNRSTNFGNSWSVALESNQPNHKSVGLQNGSGSSLTGFTWSDSLFWTTSDSGASWSSQSAPTNHVFSSGRVLYTTDNSIFLYTGNSQTILTGTTPTGARTVVDLSSVINGDIATIQKDSADIFYLGTSTGYLYSSTDRGSNWEAIPGWESEYDGFGSDRIVDISCDNSDNRFLVGTRDSGGNAKIWSLVKTI